MSDSISMDDYLDGYEIGVNPPGSLGNDDDIDPNEPIPTDEELEALTQDFWATLDELGLAEEMLRISNSFCKGMKDGIVNRGIKE